MHAKKAFGEGKALFDEGKLPEAVEKFKESYRLSQNPLLLYNIGFTLDQAGQKDKALFYYRKFLADAPQGRDAAQGSRRSASNVIEKEKLEADLNGTTHDDHARPDGGTKHDDDDQAAKTSKTVEDQAGRHVQRRPTSSTR